MSCSCNSGSGPILIGQGGVSVQGSGTAYDPYVISESSNDQSVALQVRDSGTVNLSIFGSGSKVDPYVLRADTSSASSLRSLSDVSSSTSVFQGATPMWIGSSTGGQFTFRSPGVRYTTRAARGNGIYQGELIRETDTGGRYEWDGSQWVDLSPAYVPPSALDPSVLQNAGTLDNSIDWNTLTSRSGIYRIAGFPTGRNAPLAYNFGTLTVFVSGNSVTQVYWAHSSSWMYQRTKWNTSDWGSWKRTTSSDETDALASRATTLESRTSSLTSTTTSLTSRVSSLESNSANSSSTGTVTYGPNVGPNNGCDLTKTGFVVTFRFNLSINGSKNINDNLVQLPAGFRPRTFPADTFAHNGSSTWGVAIDTDGWLRLRTAGIGGGGLWGNVTFQAA